MRRALAPRAPGLLALATLFLLVCACATAPRDGPSGGPESDLVPAPLRVLGVRIHNAVLAAGLYAVPPSPVETVPHAEAVAAMQSAARNGRLAVTWLGHSSALVVIDGMTVLTDPIFSDRASLTSPLPVRHTRDRIGLDDLPAIDAVLLSHGDYDHLHMPSLRALAGRFPEAQLFLPRGIGEARRAGFRNVHPLEVGETVSLGRASISALPVLHATRRNPLGVKDGEALGWEIASARRKVLFIGDSGYGPPFRQIGTERGPYDLALVPIGAYEPRGLVADMHATPEEAALIAQDVRAKTALGIHWGTFALSPDRSDRTAERFLRATPGGLVLRIGETKRLE